MAERDMDGRGRVFAEGDGLKTCPRCGAQLFADMDVCYGCLYDFSKHAPQGRGGETVNGGGHAPATDVSASSGSSAEGAANSKASSGEWPGPWCDGEPPDELWGSLDELWDEEPPRDAGGLHPDEGDSAVPADCGGAGCGGSACGDHGTGESALGVAGREVSDEVAGYEEPSVTSRLCAIGTSEGVARVRVYAAGLALTCAVPSSGLTIGRDADNDLALLSRSVSRRHVRLVPCDGGIVVQDLGATNPALLNGRMLVDGRRMWVGDTLEIRGSGVTIRPCPTR